MQISKLPSIQGKRFDIETLQHNAISLAKQADDGPTFLRHAGRVAYVVMTEELFDALWPDPRRAWSTQEMPFRMGQQLTDALEKSLAANDENES